MKDRASQALTLDPKDPFAKNAARRLESALVKRRSTQLELFRGESQQAVCGKWESFPKTRYLGSKRKLLSLLAEQFGRIEFDTALDPFCGTGAVAYLLKAIGKQVTATDILESNAVAARALVQNSSIKLGEKVGSLLAGLPELSADEGFVERTFDGIFYEREENRFIDQILPRIYAIDGAGRDLALYSLFQACLSKRPYNLFHRANLDMRRKDVSRSFGNKTTWDRPFPELIEKFSKQADSAVFDSGRDCRAFKADAAEIDPAGYDLIYIDPPYLAGNGAGVDYLDYYHFIEGLCRPTEWPERILHNYKHKPLSGRGTSVWCDAERIGGAFENLIKRYARSSLVISYRSDGIPKIEEIRSYLIKAGKSVEIVDAGTYVYALSRNRLSKEVVLIGR